MQNGTVREGVAAGALGASSVAVWFFLLDVVLRHPFRTPIELGRAFFTLFGQAATGGNTDMLLLIGYTVFHFAAFIVAGIVVAAVVNWAEKNPSVLAGGLILFVVFELAFYAMTSAFRSIPVLGTLAWYNVAMGNLVASITMGWYMWRAHPRLGAELRYALEGRE
ncbi:MAG TPA: hypothetical protein VG818_06480 [Gemmatimonadaceae bacterium]|jgi:hypothetical protein|nr:hypothetical protein [Gemmatimonadaceae bacterium]